MEGIVGGALLSMIRAEKKGNRYSENLMKWVRKYKEKNLFVAFATEGTLSYNPRKTQASSLYVGFHGLDKDWLHGCCLSHIIYDGVKAKPFAYPPSLKFEIIPDWWCRYVQDGKCCIDPEHRLYSDQERWAVSADGVTRDCLWCHQYSQYRHVKLVTRESWRPLDEQGDDEILRPKLFQPPFKLWFSGPASTPTWVIKDASGTEVCQFPATSTATEKEISALANIALAGLNARFPKEVPHE